MDDFCGYPLSAASYLEQIVFGNIRNEIDLKQLNIFVEHDSSFLSEFVTMTIQCSYLSGVDDALIVHAPIGSSRQYEVVEILQLD